MDTPTSFSQEALWDAQVRLEAKMMDDGRRAFLDACTRSYQAEEATSSPGGIRYVLAHLIEPTAAAIERFIAEGMSGKPGREHALVTYVTDTSPKVLAYLTAKELLDGFIRTRPHGVLAMKIGRAAELEQRICAFERTQPALIRTALRNLQARTSNVDHKRHVIVALMRRNADTWTPWGEKVQGRVGAQLLTLLTQATGCARKVDRREGKKTVGVVEMTESFMAWIVHLDARSELLSPAFLPCVIPPKPWTSLTDGAYHTDALIEPPTLVKARKDRLGRQQGDLSKVLRAVNAVQATPWRIETRTLDIMRQVVENRLDLGVLPRTEPVVIPAKPLGLPAWEKNAPRPLLSDAQEVALTEWRKEARAAYEAETKRGSKALQLRRVIGMATDYAGYDHIYFPHQLDFRGRMYALPAGLSPQGPDFAKGLLVFAEGKPLRGPQAVRWFLIHGANTFGEDKASMEDRVQWVWDHAAEIDASARDPLANKFWTEADSPWCFLTWCFEFLAWRLDGRGDFRSHIPIAMDGTCNGLQHYSAMLRDPIGGAAVNLTPADQPQDIYAEVAKVVTAKLRRLWAEAKAGAVVDMPHIYAQGWDGFCIDRTITKRPVMVLPYGGTFSSCRDYVQDAVREQIAGGKPNPFGDDLNAACAWLSTIVWDSIGEVVVAGRAAMSWLMEVTRAATNAGSALLWTAPSGFVVRQEYPQTRARRVTTKMHGQTITFSLAEDIPDTIDKRRQANGVAPNFVHSMDASALVLTVNSALDAGVTNFAMIHDSYGTLAADTETLAACTRRAFVDQYQQHDVLAEFRAAVASQLPENAADLPAVPPAGNLDLNEVLRSPFFFA